MVDVLTWAFSAGAFAVTLYLIRTRGFLDGARPAWLAVLLLVPVWFSYPALSMRLDARSACAAAVLVGFLTEPYRPDRPRRWFLSDLGVLLLILGMTASQLSARSLSPFAPFDQLRDFGLPYVVGRLFLRSARDIETILPAYCVIICALAAYSCFEAITKINPIEVPLGRPWHTSETAYDAERWGLRRAYAVQTSPIYLGLTFAMLLPFAVEAAVQSFAGRGPFWWRFVPLAVLAGVVSTVSRAAQLCAAAVLAAMFFHAFPRLRAPLIILAAAGGVLFVAAREEIVALLSQYAEEMPAGETAYVQIDGEWYEYSGTKHRDLLNVVYEEAIEGAGWLGYGAAMTRMPRDPDMDTRFKSIDNHYLLFYLQHGIVGVVLFALMALSFFVNLVPTFLRGTGPPGRLAAGLVGALGGGLVAMRSVWLAPDYAWVWMFCGGLTVAVAQLRQRPAGPGAAPRG